MKGLVEDMKFDQLQMDMVANVREVAKYGLDFKSNGECKLNINHESTKL